MIGFAHRGAPSAGTRENSLAAFTHALSHGAKALESDIWLTADGVPVMAHDQVIRVGFRRQSITSSPASVLPSWVPKLSALYESIDAEFDLSLDIKDGTAAAAVVQTARKYRADDRLWLCGTAAQVTEWRQLEGQHRLVVSTTLRARGVIPADRIDEAAQAGAAALNLRGREWSPTYTQQCHERGMLAFAWGVRQRGTLKSLRTFGCDAVYSDHLKLLAGL